MADLADVAAVQNETADVVKVGGGPVGSALALALQPAGWRVVLLEARTAVTGDARPLALSYGSRLILERLGVWPALAAAATPIRHIHVSQRGGFDRVGLEAAGAGLPDLGYVIDYGALSRQLSHAATVSTADCRIGARVDSWQDGDPALVTYEIAGAQRRLAAPLVVAAYLLDFNGWAALPRAVHPVGSFPCFDRRLSLLFFPSTTGMGHANT